MDTPVTNGLWSWGREAHENGACAQCKFARVQKFYADEAYVESVEERIKKTLLSQLQN